MLDARDTWVPSCASGTGGVGGGGGKVSSAGICPGHCCTISRIEHSAYGAEQALRYIYQIELRGLGLH